MRKRTTVFVFPDAPDPVRRLCQDYWATTHPERSFPVFGCTTSVLIERYRGVLPSAGASLLPIVRQHSYLEVSRPCVVCKRHLVARRYTNRAAYFWETVEGGANAAARRHAKLAMAQQPGFDSWERLAEVLEGWSCIGCLERVADMFRTCAKSGVHSEIPVNDLCSSARPAVTQANGDHVQLRAKP